MPIVGIRPGEKIHEEMITSADSFNTFDLEKYFIILPSDDQVKEMYRRAGINLNRVEYGFSYNSLNNPNFLSVEKIRRLIREHIDKSFQPL